MPPASPVLVNSCFSELDYFSQSTSSYYPVPSSSIGSSSSPKFLPYHTADDYSRLASSSPELSAKEVARMSVHMGERLVNWARPIRNEVEAIRIFGASSQRNRRLNKPISSPSSSSSSDDGPLTPSPRVSAAETRIPEIEIPSLSWSVPIEGKGLGVFGVAEWDAAYIEQDTPKQSQTHNIDLASPSIDCIELATPTPRSRASAQTLNTLASPSTLDELAGLRQAALDLETEARRPMKPAAPKEKRIKRKAVPVLFQADFESTCVYIDATVPIKKAFSMRHPNRPRSRTSYVAPPPQISPRVASLPFSIPERRTSNELSALSDSESSFGSRSGSSRIRSNSSTSSASDDVATPQSGTPPLGAEKLLLDVEQEVEKLTLGTDFVKRFEVDSNKGRTDFKKGFSRLLKL